MKKGLRILCVWAALGAAGSGLAFEELKAEHQKSIEQATKWLLKAQNKDGSWGLEENAAGDITCTALGGLALLAGGTTDREGSAEASVRAVRNAAEYIMRAARRAKDDISAGQVTLIQNKLGARVHNFFAVVFLTQVYGMRPAGMEDETAEEMKRTIEKLSEIIARTQEADGSWHKETFGSLKATCMAWLALRAAASTGAQIRHAAVDRTLKFIKSQYNPSTKLYDGGGRMSGYQALYATASSVRVMVGMGLGEEQQSRDAMDSFYRNAKNGEWGQMFLTVEGEDYLAAAMMSHSLIEENGERWEKWFTYVRDALLKRQNADGSWTSTACIRGRTFATACSLLALETPYRLLPIQQ